MPAGLSSLPFDILFALSEYLSLEDAVHVGLTCRQLSAILKESTLCRRVIEVSANCSPEANRARKRKLSYESALQQIYRRRTALRKGEPYYVQAVAKAETFLYSGGVLCMLVTDTITIHNLGGDTNHDCSISLASLRDRLADFGYGEKYVVKPLSLHEQVLVISLQAERDIEENYLLGLGLGSESSYKILFIRPLESINELFVRQNATHVCYGTHSGVGDRHHHEWIIRSIALKDPQGAHSDDQVQLEDFVGCEIGATVDFKLHDGYLYAVSNQTSFTVEEVDWTSFYTVIRFPVDSVNKDNVEVNPDIYRRQHADGPIHDSWTSLSLQHDDSSKHLYIVESRREWLEGGSKQTRTFYKERIWFPPKADQVSDLCESDADVPRAPLMPTDDLFSTVVTSNDNPRYAPRQERSPDQWHPEYGNLYDKAPSFIVAKTKMRSYNLSCSAFVDLVEDTKCCGPMSNCLRLRIGSRQPSPSQPAPLDTDYGGTSHIASGKSAAQDPYRYSNIRLWPPAQSLGDASSMATGKAHCAMNPHLQPPDALPAYLGLQVTAVCDERSIVYMVKPARPRCDADRLGTVVFISFDPSMRRGCGAPSSVDGNSADRLLLENGAWARESFGWPGSSMHQML